ncbi:MAG: glycosyltransferase family 4 protein [Anaerolineae bacterium]|jgi:glycosyltransferase involved in cell wall biosynthesis|nr:glycosyltransferase family 4 protein [Anaerolineae bacterium]MBT7189622.1 glycosyltransferase family 4 protein [Anaerolineae bacterium]MBT7991850.1 glycosyltransferase family 4 protein [Anaerolineae bacterium]
MRVGLVIYGSLDTLSGGYLYDRKLVAHLRDAGDEVEIVSLPWRNYAAHLTDNFSASLLRRLAGSRFDVLVQDELNHPSLFWLNRRLCLHPNLPPQGEGTVPSHKGRGRRVRATPIISIVHHLRSSEMRAAWQNRLYRIPERTYLRSIDGFIFNSKTTRGVVEKTIGESRPHVVAYPAGNRLAPSIDRDEISARARQKRALKIAFLGSVIPRKNLHTLLDALALLTRKSWELIIVGSLDTDPKYVQRIRAQVARLGFGNEVAFAGSLDDEPLKAILRHSHLLALPSSYEGFGIAYLEGMSFGLPAIGGSDGAAHEIITHGVDGFLGGANDRNTLAAHLRELADDREKLIQMSLAARERYLVHPTWDESAKKIRAFLRKALKG